MTLKQESPRMDRRQALRTLSVVFGACSTLPVFDGLSAKTLMAQGKAVHDHVTRKGSAQAPVTDPVFLNAHQSDTVAAISELIIPKTTTPGAKEAKVHQFIDVLLTSLDEKFQKEFLAGLAWMDERSNELFQKNFVQSTPEQQTELLTKISVDDSSEDRVGQNFFKQIKSLTVFGYYTSKEGMEQELGYQGPMHPGVYEGCTHPEHQAS